MRHPATAVTGLIECRVHHGNYMIKCGCPYPVATGLVRSPRHTKIIEVRTPELAR